MNMTQIRANTRISGEYGKLRTGETGYCKPSTAKELQMRGLATIVQEDVEHEPKKVKPFITLEGLNKPQPQAVLYKDPEPETKQKEEKDTGEDKAPVEKKEYDTKPEKKVQTHVPKKQYNQR